MPKKVLPTYFEYKGFLQALREINTYKVGSKEEQRFLKKNKISLDKTPRPQDVYDDICINYNLNGYRVKVRTTIKEEPFQVSKSDSAWIIIENEQGKAVMYSQPIHRTKNFFNTMLNQFKIFQKIVDERPLCTCGADMNIEKDGLRSYRFICATGLVGSGHMKPVDVYDYIWVKLPKKLRLFLDSKKSKERYNKRKATEKGKKFGIAAEKRKPWSKEQTI